MARAIVDLGNSRAAPPAGWEVLDADAVREAFAPGRAWSSLGRYEAVELRVEDRRALLSFKPLMAARLLARGPCTIVDAAGTRVDVSWRALPGVLVRAARDRLAWPGVRRRVAAALSALDSDRAPPRAGEGPPLYLRSDLWFGLRAGGSVGHIAGVVKGLAAQGLAPVMATPERVPTVPAFVPVIDLVPRQRAWPSADWQLLEFNLDCRDQVLAAWQGPPPRFVYQRHGLYGFAGLMLARHWDVPLVLEYNGPEVWVADHWGRSLAERSLAGAAERISLARADLIAVVSDVLKRDLVAAGHDPARIAVIPNAVDPAIYRPDLPVADLKTRLGLGGRTVVGFIGTFGPWHGVEVLVEAFGQMLQAAPERRGDCVLLLVGDGTRMAAVREAAARLGLAGSVVFAGLVPQEEGAAHVAAFDIAVAPTVPNPDGSAFFGSPTKLFEYMAAGCAIAASAIGQVEDIVRDGETGLLVPPGDAGALAAALLRLAGDGDLRRRLGTAARNEAVTCHGIDRRAADLLAALGPLATVTGGQLDGRGASV